ncbi:Rpn family recombination-promoting nuclease/putative transposase [Pedobacter steynii]
MSYKNLQPSPFIDPFVDWSFKRIFSTEESKVALIGFLNEILRGRKHIVSIEYSKNEHPGEIKEEGGATIDVSCTGDDGGKFLIEIQRGYQKFFKERALYYTSRLISEQAPKGNRKDWEYNLTEVYLIALLENFNFPDSDNDEYLHDICLINRRTGKIFYDKLSYTYIEMRNFVKTEQELDSALDKWLYALKHMKELPEQPAYLSGPDFEKLFSLARYANLTKEERDMYNASLKAKWDNKNVLDYAVEQGVERGREEERLKIAINLISKMDASDEVIADLADLPITKIKELRENLNK